MSAQVNGANPRISRLARGVRKVRPNAVYTIAIETTTASRYVAGRGSVRPAGAHARAAVRGKQCLRRVPPPRLPKVRRDQNGQGLLRRASHGRGSEGLRGL